VGQAFQAAYSESGRLESLPHGGRLRRR